MADVLIAGAGISRFGRTEHTTGREHAVRAVHAALADAGIPWSRVGAAFGGSDAAGLADTSGAAGLTACRCHVRNGARPEAGGWVGVNASAPAGRGRLAVGVESIPGRPIRCRPTGSFPRPTDRRLMVTTQWFGRNPRTCRARDRARTLGGCGEEYRNGA